MSRIILLNKPFQVLSQFRDNDGRATLKQYLPNHEGFYPAGRLDYDSEGLMLLTDDGQLQQHISNPKHKQTKTYWAQVEGIPNEASLSQFRQGLTLKDGPTRPAKVKAIPAPEGLWERTPPIRERQSIPTQWLEITITEGRNRQVRRMTAAIGHPTLRLIRSSIGDWKLENMQPGEHREEVVNTPNPPSARKNASGRHGNDGNRRTSSSTRSRKQPGAKSGNRRPRRQP